ncbi:MAG: hypothetical protein JWQ94_4938 [Tardiphaga sp.]|nr:hypothetical protein [Tardiphaga sp.]
MAKFEEALAWLKPAQQLHMRNAVHILREKGPGIATRITANIKSEFRVTDLVWSNVFEALLAVDLEDPDLDTAGRILEALRKALTRSLEPVSRAAGIPCATLVGPVVDGLQPKAYGRLISVPTLRYYWKTAALGGSAIRLKKPRVPARAIDEIVLDLQTQEGLDARKEGDFLQLLPLGLFVLWSTFDGEDFDHNPFPSMPDDMTECAALLGLDDKLLFGDNRSRRCVLLCYRLPSAVKPRVPTVVEAYAGSSRLNYYFEVYSHQVSVSLKQFPRTLPSPLAQDRRGLPEIIHEVVFADQLTMPIKMATLRS